LCELAACLVDGTFNIFLRHIGTLGILDCKAQPGIIVGQGIPLFHGHLDLFYNTRKKLAPFGIERSLFPFDG